MQNRSPPRTSWNDDDAENNDPTQLASPRPNPQQTINFENCDAISGDDRIDKIRLRICINRTTNMAMLKLSRKMHLRFQKFARQTIYVHIFPENICTLSFEMDEGVPSLHFSLNQISALIVPAGYPAEAKEEALLKSMRALSLAKAFTVRLNNTTEAMEEELRQIGLLFSATNNRPTTDINSAELRSLYGGRGGEDANARITTAETTAETTADLPPSYEASLSDGAKEGKPEIKRKRPAADDGVLLTKKPNVGPEAMEKRLRRSLKSYLEHLVHDREVRVRNEVTGHYHETTKRIRHVKRDLAERIKIKVDEEVNQSMETLKTESQMAVNDAITDKVKEIEDWQEENEALVEHRVNTKLEEVDVHIKEIYEHLEAIVAELVAEQLKAKLSKIQLQVTID